jgi:hypothetical protein
MDVLSTMQDTELEVRRLLQFTPAQAMRNILELYHQRPASEQEALVIVLAARVTAAFAVQRNARDLSTAQRGST